jgi:hypothetical protein
MNAVLKLESVESGFGLKLLEVCPLGRWAAGPLGRWAAGPLGRWAAGPLFLSIEPLPPSYNGLGRIISNRSEVSRKIANNLEAGLTR